MPHKGRRAFLISLGAAGTSAAIGHTLYRCLMRSETQPPPLAPAGLIAAKRSGLALGTRVSMAVLHTDRRVAERGLDAAFAALERVEQIMSIYRPSSQLSQLNRSGVLDDPHPLLVQILRAARRISIASRGAFDVTVQPLWDVHAKGKPPSPSLLSIAQSRVGWARLGISRKRIWFQRSGMAATLNGIAQGFATDHALAALRRAGIRHALVNTGELGALGQTQQGDDWVVGIQHPRVRDAHLALARLDGRCIATSGDYATPRGHLFDPATGKAAKAFQSVTVLARSGLEADSLSTAVFVAGPERGAALIEATPNADALLVHQDGRTLATRGFPRVS